MTQENAAVCYVRVSTDGQANEGVSLEAQEEKIRAYCEMQDLEVLEVIEDKGVSGGKSLAEREGGKKLLEQINEHNPGHVVALKLDRLFRDTVDALEVTKEWDESGTALHLVDMGGQTVNTGSAMGRFFLNMMAGFAELERNLTAERTEQALSHKKENGEAYTRTPYGLQRDGDSFLKDPEEMQTVHRIRRLRENGKTLQEIADVLNEDGIETKRGGKWYAKTVSNILDNDYEQVA